MLRSTPVRSAGLFLALALILLLSSPAAAAPVAPFPFSEDFESGTLAGYWEARSTGTGRILVTSANGPYAGRFHLLMDSSRSWYYCLNELVLTIDLSGRSGVHLRFYHKEFGDEDHFLPNIFTGSRPGDGVAVSADGVTWHKVQGLTRLEGVSSAWKMYDVDLDAAAAAAGLQYNGTFKIKFQQYDNYPIPSDGFAFDDISVYPTVADSDSDGLPDDWERRYFGDLSQGPEGDPDGDGLSNLAEFQGGTDPTVSNLPPSPPAAAFPFREDFEGGSLAGHWEARSTGAGRILVTGANGPRGGYHLTMDSSRSGAFSANELILTINLAGKSGVRLRFYHKEFGDEDHSLPNSFQGSTPGDGVAVSADGTTWYKVKGLTSADGIGSAWKLFEVNLDAAAAAAGIAYNETFKIKFQQYDNYPIPTDGFAFDEIAVEPADNGGGGNLLPQETELIALINQQRLQNNLPPLRQSDALCAAARRHSADMAQNDFLSHTGSDGSSPWDRMRQAGYQLSAGGENVGAGFPTATDMVNGWMNSPGHRANILGSFCDLGVGYATGSSYGAYWTLDLGCQ